VTAGLAGVVVEIAVSVLLPGDHAGAA
jgi:hypothetical protein